MRWRKEVKRMGEVGCDRNSVLSSQRELCDRLPNRPVVLGNLTRGRKGKRREQPSWKRQRKKSRFYCRVNGWGWNNRKLWQGRTEVGRKREKGGRSHLQSQQWDLFTHHPPDYYRAATARRQMGGGRKAMMRRWDFCSPSSPP